MDKSDISKSNNSNTMLYKETIKNCTQRKENIKKGQQPWSAEMYGIIIQYPTSM